MAVIGQSAGKSFAYLLGVFLGDGCVTLDVQKKLVFRLNTIDQDFAEAVKAALHDLTQVRCSLSVHPVSKSSKPNWSLTNRDTVLATRLRQDTERKKIIPAYVFDWPRENKLAFIIGLMDSEGFVAANSNTTGRRFYMGYKSCDPWISELIRLMHSVGIKVGKVGVEEPRKPGYKTPRRFAIKMQSWVDSGARFNIARKQQRVDQWAATIPDPRGLRSQAKLTSETTRQTPEGVMI